MNDPFETVEQTLTSGGPDAGFDFLLRKFRGEKNYPALFETLLMKLRHDLGLPLIQTGVPRNLPEETQRAYDQGSVEAAREVGGLFLADGEIERAWPYFRAIGETSLVAEAIEQVTPDQAGDRLIEIAFFERVHPRKGLELILANHGICRAITMFGQYPGPEGREESAAVIVRSLHAELVDNLKRAIAQQEGQGPDTESIPELIEGRDWLFEGNNYYVDTSHVASVVQFSPELTERDTLALVVEVTEYGQRLGPMFQFKGQPPFDDLYQDHGVYLKALLGVEVGSAIAHFRRKVTHSDPHEVGNVPAQVLVKLLARLERYAEAVEVFREHVGDGDADQLLCPSPLELCQLAEDYTRLRDLAHQRKDLLSFTAAVVQERGRN